MKNKDKLQGICTISVYLSLYFIVPFILVILPINYNDWNINAKIIFNIAYDLLLISITYLIMKDTIKDNFFNYIKNIKMYLSKYIKYWFLALGLMLTSNIIIQMFTHRLPQNEESVRTLFDKSPILFFILATCLGPIIEEFIFRLSIYKILRNHKKLFIVISGLLFGGAHIIGNISSMIDILYIIPYGVPGCVFAYTLVKSDNIFVPISLHLFNNTFALILQIISMILK